MPAMPNLETLRKETGERLKRRLETIREQADCLVYPSISGPVNLNAIIHELEMAKDYVLDLVDLERDAKRAENAVSVVDDAAKAQVDRMMQEDRAAVAITTTRTPPWATPPS